MRKLASIRQISDIRPIEGADRIEVAQVDGWECVVKKGEFQAGEQVVYIEVDSVVPDRPEFAFLKDRKFRVRTIKLRGQISQGLVLPLSILPEGDYALGADVTDILGIKKYNPQAQQEEQLLAKRPQKQKNTLARFLMHFEWYRRMLEKQKQKSAFPDWISKTDETRIQNLPELFEAERDKGTRFSVTEKMDGQSATYYLRRISKHRYEFGVCSRNVHLCKPDNSSYWRITEKYDIEHVLRELIGGSETVVMQGEICGPAIQKNKYRLDGYELFVFNLIYPEHKCTTSEIRELCAPFSLKTVPLLEEGKTLPPTITELVGYSKGCSTVYPTQKREGVVLRDTENNISFKVINPDFLLEEGD